MSGRAVWQRGTGAAAAGSRAPAHLRVRRDGLLAAALRHDYELALQDGNLGQRARRGGK
jgi:hypothetical protein